MRIMFAAAVLAASCVAAAAPGLAASPVSLPQLAPGEVLLEVHGLGIVRTPATSAVISTTLYGRGTSEADAQRSLDAEIQRATAAARAAGAAPADIVLRPGPSSSDAVYDFDVVETGGTDGTPRSRMYMSQTTLVIRLRNAAAARDLSVRVGGSEPSGLYSGLNYELADDRAPRRDARRQAMAAARADAETYADAIGMRIVRVVRITERAGLDFASLPFTERAATSRFNAGFGRSVEDAQVETIAVVGVDYVLGPR
jgi:hypothetical protein